MAAATKAVQQCPISSLINRPCLALVGIGRKSEVGEWTMGKIKECKFYFPIFIVGFL